MSETRNDTYKRSFAENVKRHLGLGNRQRQAAHDRDIRERQQYLAGRPAARTRTLEDGALRPRIQRNDMPSRPTRGSR